jgi:hypothetical protein
MRSGILVGSLLVVLGSSPAFGQPAPVGRVKIAKGTAFVVRGDQALPAKVGDPLYEADALRTGPDGQLGVTLKDETRISLGPASEVRVDRFVYAPAESQCAVALRLVRGVAAYVSGRIAKLAPDSIRLETPAAIVGIRGTSLALRAE